MNGRLILRVTCSFWKPLILLPFFGWVLACSHSGPNTYVRPDYDGSHVKRVAVFPFYNTSQIPGAGEIVTGIFIAELVKSGKYQVEFPGNIKDFLIKERIIVRTGVDLDTIRLMGKRLGVDGVFLGQVEEYSGSQEGRGDVVPMVSITVRLVDAGTGKILFMSNHNKTGDDFILVLDFGKIRSVGELTKRVTQEMIALMP